MLFCFPRHQDFLKTIQRYQILKVGIFFYFDSILAL
ncbi:hypothetical protein PF003_g23283 [Phytophthora fragariae]|nr:hypothetical protein PF003_g23283 [Phytophthora fragariae]